MHHACIVRSPHGAAKIRSIDSSKLWNCRASPLSSPARTPRTPLRPCGASLPGLRVPHHHLLANDRVYLVGHPVAVVVATDRYIARDAADLVEVEYEPLPAVADPEKAIAQARPQCIRNGPTMSPSIFIRKAARSKSLRRGRGRGQAAHHQPAADPNFDGNARLRGRLAHGRQGAYRAPLDTNPTSRANIIGMMLGLPEHHVRVIAPEVGGGFGSKIKVYAEEALMSFISMKIGKPVKWIESRRENFTVDHPWPRSRGLLRNSGQARWNHVGDQAEADSGSGRVTFRR